MRFRRKITARTTAVAVALGLVGVLAFAEPAFAAASITFSPALGAPGTPVTITGTGTAFTSGGVTVKFNGTSATFTVVNDLSISTSVPCGATDGTVAVTDTTDGTVTSGASFDVTAAGTPTVTSFNPTSGTAGVTSVAISGTNFCGATAVLFNATAATTKTVNSATQITATVPTGATTGPIHVTAVGTGSSSASFTVGPPVITSFAPTIGLAGTTVVITGSNLLNVSSVTFNALAAVFTVNSSTQITTTVPTGATTGPIKVTNAVGTATGSTFTVGVPTHSRTVSFSYHGHRAAGNVNVGDGFSACKAFVPVYIQQLRNGNWKLLDTTATNASGAYNTWVPDKVGLFRARVQHQSLTDGSSCGGDLSPTRHHA